MGCFLGRLSCRSSGLYRPDWNGCTNRNLVESVIQLLRDFGVGKIFIAESTFGDRKMTDMFFHKTGYAALARKYGIGLFNLNGSEAVEVEVKNPLVPDKLRIAREVVDAISCMERMGPRGGDTVSLNLVMAGESSAEADCIGCAVMGYDVGDVRHLKYFIEANGVDPALIPCSAKNGSRTGRSRDIRNYRRLTTGRS